MQAENTNCDIQTVSFGCRLNSLESEKIKKMLTPAMRTAIVVNTCAVTGEAERQSGQHIRRIARENPHTPIFVTGCAATRNPDLFANIPNVVVIPNDRKHDLTAYTDAISGMDITSTPATPALRDKTMSKQFIQIQNGCNHDCTYCVTRLLRGPSVSFDYGDILADARAAVADGFYEIVLTGIDIASYARLENGRAFMISDLCAALLRDVPEIRRLRLSSIDPASPEIPRIVDLMRRDARMMRHMHLSMQSGSDTVLSAMRRRHTGAQLVQLARNNPDITFSADIICGFPGETDELFNQTMNVVREMGLIHAHAFPFSPRPGTVAATMPNQVPRNIARARVHEISAAADENRIAYMQRQIGTRTSVLVEQNNIARTPDDIAVKIAGEPIAPRTICDVELSDISRLQFVGKVC